MFGLSKMWVSIILQRLSTAKALISIYEDIHFIFSKIHEVENVIIDPMKAKMSQLRKKVYMCLLWAVSPTKYQKYFFPLWSPLFSWSLSFHTKWLDHQKTWLAKPQPNSCHGLQCRAAFSHRPFSLFRSTDLICYYVAFSSWIGSLSQGNISSSYWSEFTVLIPSYYIYKAVRLRQDSILAMHEEE